VIKNGLGADAPIEEGKRNAGKTKRIPQLDLGRGDREACAFFSKLSRRRRDDSLQ